MQLAPKLLVQRPGALSMVHFPLHPHMAFWASSEGGDGTLLLTNPSAVATRPSQRVCMVGLLSGLSTTGGAVALSPPGCPWLRSMMETNFLLHLLCQLCFT